MAVVVFLEAVGPMSHFVRNWYSTKITLAAVTLVTDEVSISMVLSMFVMFALAMLMLLQKNVSTLLALGWVSVPCVCAYDARALWPSGLAIQRWD